MIRNLDFDSNQHPPWIKKKIDFKLFLRADLLATTRLYPT
jgi:hypothetical protein